MKIHSSTIIDILISNISFINYNYKYLSTPFIPFNYAILRIQCIIFKQKIHNIYNNEICKIER